MDKFLGNKKAVMLFTLPSLLLFGGLLLVSVVFSFLLQYIGVEWYWRGSIYRFRQLHRNVSEYDF